MDLNYKLTDHLKDSSPKKRPYRSVSVRKSSYEGSPPTDQSLLIRDYVDHVGPNEL